MIRRLPRSTRTDTRFSDTTRFRSHLTGIGLASTNSTLFKVARRALSWRVSATLPCMAAMHNSCMSLGATLAVTEISRSEEHTSELQSPMRISYAVFCLKKKKNTTFNTLLPTYNTQYYYKKNY